MIIKNSKTDRVMYMYVKNVLFTEKIYIGVDKRLAEHFIKFFFRKRDASSKINQKEIIGMKLRDGRS